MKLTRLLAVLSVAMLATACERATGVTVNDPGPLAFVRFVNAVVDTGAMDYKFVDRIDNANAINWSFRSVTSFQGTNAGSRKLRVFPSSTDLAVTTAHLVDTTITLNAGEYYTILHTGSARAASGATADRIVVLQHTVTDPGSGNVGVRLVNTALGGPTVAGAVTTAASDPVPATPTFSNVAALGGSNIVPRPVGAATIRVSADNFATVLASGTYTAGSPPSAAGTQPAAGTTQAGSVITAFLFPGATAGSRAATATNTTPGFGFGIDRHPPF